MKLLKQLSETPGVPGREERVRNLIRQNVEEYCDEIDVDALGNLICLKKATTGDGDKNIMISCHMDEIGFYVKKIDKNGFLRIQSLGGFDTRNLFARQVLIQGREDIKGTLNPSTLPVHIAEPKDRKEVPPIGKFFVDIGLDEKGAKEVVKPGDPVSLIQEFIELNDNASGKSMDNRVACWVGIETLKRLKETPHNVTVVFTVQEEVGIRGAIVASYEVNPDIGIAIDVTLAVDQPGVSPEDGITDLGKGVAIKIMDGHSISNKGLVDHFTKIAETEGITYQYEVLPLGGTDAGGMQKARSGTKVITLSVPCRYVHTVTETINKKDLAATADLLIAALEKPFPV